MLPVVDETGLSIIRWEHPSNAEGPRRPERGRSPPPQAIADEAGLSFVGWRQKGNNTKKRSHPRRSPHEQLRHGSIKQFPRTPRKLSKYRRHSREGENFAAPLSPRSGTVSSERQQPISSLQDVVVDEAGLSVVGWKYSNVEAPNSRRGTQVVPLKRKLLFLQD
ncbi:hypothetical protein CERZMDRAFT_89732 [Cercospora zeae-maydis SCOH1-5]|uniref:Uncharacterized protein n=1 Tax=Cercospora zeae-maydis SCOH1-5 TaxID=717836 RepID=A0A6A6FU72_9PEZI|nr:hypothetical protein CERZMDRAFT_89732 [Cercospora zeae-maydis SCOH1-5]